MNKYGIPLDIDRPKTDLQDLQQQVAILAKRVASLEETVHRLSRLPSELVGYRGGLTPL